MKKILTVAALIAGFTSSQAADFHGNVVSNNFDGITSPVGNALSVGNTVSGMREAARKFDGPIGYPGNTWGTVVYGAHAPAGYPEYRIEGIVEQGVDWFRFSKDMTWKFNTYGAFEYVINSNTKGITPVIGLKFNKAFSDGSLDLGLRYKYGNTCLSPTGFSNPGGTKKVSRVELYATYWFAWDLKGK